MVLPKDYVPYIEENQLGMYKSIGYPKLALSHSYHDGNTHTRFEFEGGVGSARLRDGLAFVSGEPGEVGGIPLVGLTPGQLGVSDEAVHPSSYCGGRVTTGPPSASRNSGGTVVNTVGVPRNGALGGSTSEQISACAVGGVTTCTYYSVCISLAHF
jgi:hypothetical protein